MKVDLLGHDIRMIWLIAATLTLLYLLFWPFSVRLNARLSLTSGRGEVVVGSLLRFRLEGDFLQPPFFVVYLLKGNGERKPLRRRKGQGRGFWPVLRGGEAQATVYVGLEEDGAATVELLGLLYVLLEALGEENLQRVAIRPVPCFDKNICALRLSGIGRLVLAQNILEYRKGRKHHAIR